MEKWKKRGGHYFDGAPSMLNQRKGNSLPTKKNMWNREVPLTSKIARVSPKKLGQTLPTTLGSAFEISA
eukprot:1145868-Pelagomonas_calceolata.AAC.2